MLFGVPGTRNSVFSCWKLFSYKIHLEVWGWKPRTSYSVGRMEEEPVLASFQRKIRTQKSKMLRKTGPIFLPGNPSCGGGWSSLTSSSRPVWDEQLRVNKPGIQGLGVLLCGRVLAQHARGSRFNPKGKGEGRESRGLSQTVVLQRSVWERSLWCHPSHTVMTRPLKFRSQSPS